MSIDDEKSGRERLINLELNIASFLIIPVSHVCLKCKDCWIAYEVIFGIEKIVLKCIFIANIFPLFHH